MDIERFCRHAAVVPLMLVLTGCGAGLGTIGTLGTIAELVGARESGEPAPQEARILAEVQRVDMERQVIQVTTPEGRAGGVTYDLGTEVLHEQRPYAVASLAAGDVVALHLVQADPATLYARRVEVLEVGEAAAERTAAAEPAEPTTPDAPPAPADPAQPEVVELEGEVLTVDRERGSFRVETADRRTVTVTLPYDPRRSVIERFDRLRSGETVRFEAEPVGPTRVELQRFL